MIKYYEVDIELSKINNMIPVRIYHYGDLQTVYVERVTQNGIWGRHSTQAQAIKLWPNRNVRIVKIGSQRVQSWLEFQQEKRDYYDMLRTINAENKRKLYADAYRHSKKSRSSDE